MTEAIFRLFEGLASQGPGSEACTREALGRLPTLPERPRVVDMGCGAGRQTLVLAAALGVRITAIDIHQRFLDQLAAAAKARGLGDLVETRCEDMSKPSVAPGSVDLLWSEGAIYLLGFGAGLRLWRPLLAPGGLVAVTECSWLSDARPAEAYAFWREAYPTMGGIEENLATAEREGFEALGHLTLPQAAWDDFYQPLEARMAALAPSADPALAEEIGATRQEIELFRRFGDVYGYVFYLLRNPA